MRPNTVPMCTLLGLLWFTSGCGPSGGEDNPDIAAGPPDSAWATTIEFTAPDEGTVVGWPVVEVAGAVHGAPCGQLLINDVAIPWNPPLFSAPVPLEAEGPNTITARCGDAAATITVFLDSLPPYLELLEPAGPLVLPDLGPGDLVQLLGIAHDEAGVSVSVQGNPLLVDSASSTFAAPWPLAPGLNFVSVEAVDANGNRSREHRPVLPGPFAPCLPENGRPDVVVRLSDGAIKLAASKAAAELVHYDFGPLLAQANPVYDSEQLRLNLDSFSLGAPVTLETVAVEGSFSAALFVGSVSIGGTLISKTGTLQWSFSAEIDGLSANASVVPAVSQGALTLSVGEVAVAAGQVKLSVKDQDGKSVVAPTEITGNFLEFFTELLSTFLQDAADQAVVAISRSAQGESTFTFLGVQVMADYSPESIQVSGHQVTVGYLVDLELPAVKAVEWPHGCPSLGGSAPLPPPPVDLETASFGLSLSQDFLNRVLTGLWEAGDLFVVVDQELLDSNKLEVELVCGLAGSLVDLVASPPNPEWPLAIHITPPLPPLLQPAGATGKIGLAFGGIGVELYALEPGGASRLFTSVALSMLLGLEASVGSSDLVFSLSISDFFIELDQSMAELQKRTAERDIESFFESLVPEISDSLAQSLVAYHLPLFYGAEVVEGKVSMTGEGYLVVQGRLVDKEGPP